jgi:hypothetical protein
MPPTVMVMVIGHLCRIASHVGNGSWSCKNALAVALTPRAVGDVALRGNSFGVWPFSVRRHF